MPRAVPRAPVVRGDQLGELLQRTGVNGAVVGDGPVLERDHAVADVDDLGEVVGDHDHRRPAPTLQLADQVEDDHALLDPHRRQRLIEEDHLGVGEHRPGDGDGLTLATGQERHLRVDRR